MPAVLPNWQGQYEVPQDIQSWKGSIFSIFSKHAANWNGSGYGPLLMTPAVSHPHCSTCHALHGGRKFPLHYTYIKQSRAAAVRALLVTLMAASGI